MKNRIFLLLFIILLIITIFIFFITSSDTYNENAEQFFNTFNTNNRDTQQIVNNDTNMFSEQKMAEGGNIGEVTRELQEGTVTNTSATIIIVNRTNVKFDCVVWYSIEKQINDEWLEISSKSINDINMESNIIMPNKSVELKLDWTNVYGELKSGKYRLVLPSISNFNGHDYIEFSIK